MMRESRLIGISLDQLNRQRKQAGVKTPVVPQNARSTDAAAEVQSAELLAKRQATPGVNAPAGYEKPTPDVQEAQRLIDERNRALTPLRTDPRNPTGFVPEGAKVGDERFQTPAAQMAARVDARRQSRLDGTRAKIAAEEASGARTYTPEEKAAMEQTAIQEDRAEREQQQAQQQQERTRMTDSAASSEASKRTQPTPPATPQTAALQSIVAQYPELAPFADAITQSLQANSQAQTDLTKGLAAQGEMFTEMKNDVKSTLDRITTEAKTASSGIQDLLKQAREDNEEAITAQETAQKERLAWEEQRQVRKLNDEKRKTADRMVASLALRGGFGSGAGLQEIEEVSAQYEQAISDVQREFGVQRTELAAKFTALHADNVNTYATNTANNVKELRSTLERISLQGLSSRQAIAQAEQGALQTFIANQVNLRKDAAKQFQDGMKEMRGMIQDERNVKFQREQQQKTTAYSMFTWAFTNSSDPALRRAAADMMRKAGYDLPQDLDYAALTVDDQLALMDGAKEADAASVYDIGQFEEREDQAIYSMALNAVTGLTGADGSLREAHLSEVARHLRAGDRKAAEKTVRGIAALKLKGETPEFAARGAFISEAEQLINTLESTAQTRNLYATKWQDFMKYLAANQNEDYLGLSAWMGNLTAETIKERYGSAFTEVEATQMERSIPSGKETVQDAVVKFKQLIRNAQVKNDAMISTLLGQASYTPSAQTQQDMTYDSGWVLSTMRGETPAGADGGEESPAGVLMSLGRGLSQKFDTPIKPRSQGGLYDEGTYRAWGGTHKGLDIRVPQNTPVPAPTDGVIVEAGYNGGWGGTIKFRDPKGAEHRIAHLSYVPSELKPGMPIRRGQLIAKSGGQKGTKGAGNSTGPHIDYRIWHNGKYVDPLTYS